MMCVTTKAIVAATTTKKANYGIIAIYTRKSQEQQRQQQPKAKLPPSCVLRNTLSIFSRLRSFESPDRRISSTPLDVSTLADPDSGIQTPKEQGSRIKLQFSITGANFTNIL